MKNAILRSMIIATGALFIAISGFTTELKTSSLVMTKPQTNGILPEQCQKMFQEVDKLIADAEKQPGTHTQMQTMKNKLSSSKQQILKLDLIMQKKSCNKGLVALNGLKHNSNGD
ncbi:DUF5339 domain-containing protein [Glaesserella parasuis]|uniref:DUF5339 domain-containing protein n=1 Tax=Glaesserella parasuis TaxID=738 RepID=UPI0038532592